jgi:hypothetical protein
VAVVGGGLLGASALFGWVGLSPSASADTRTVAYTYVNRTRVALHDLHAKTLLPIELVGAALAGVTRGVRAADAMLRLGVSWLIVVAGGVIVALSGREVPGARFLQFGLPIPVLYGLAAAAVGMLLLRRTGPLRRLVAAVVMIAVVGAVLLPHIKEVVEHRTVHPRGDPAWSELDAAAVYLNRLHGLPPVVFLVDQPGYLGAFTPKLRYYVVRSVMPANYVHRTFVYVGRLSNLEAGRPTLVSGSFRWQRSYNINSLQAWKQVEPALRQGAIVLIAQHYAKEPFQEALRQDPTREVAPGLYVVRGPVLPVGPAPPPPPFDRTRGLASASGFLILLVLVGWGWARAALRDTGATPLDVACLAPAVGAGISIPPAFIVAALGGDPKGPIGIALLAALAIGGAALGLGRSPARIRAENHGTRVEAGAGVM